MQFDAIIIGTGMGGATTGYALAKSGMRVLFMEKGLSRFPNNQMIQGVFAETKFNQHQSSQEILKRSGRSTRVIYDTSEPRAKKFTPFIGEGSGGSSALYGAILERFNPEDFTNKKKQDNSSSSDCSWPLSYQQMSPYYQKAEKLYGVSSAIDGKKQVLSKANQRIWGTLETNGLHPYFLPSASARKIGCIDNCQSYLCREGCKNDSEKNCLTPAISEYDAILWDNCEVLKLEENKGRIEKIIYRHNQKIFSIKSDLVILAAGALATPFLLFQSSNSKWPKGLANSSDLLGRYLMRHYIDLFAVEMPGLSINEESQKQIGFNDFYLLPEGKFGTVQSFGQMPPIEVALEELIESAPFGEYLLRRFIKLVRPLLDGLYKKQFSNKLVFASIMEDSPNYHNRVMSENNTLALHYKISKDDYEKIEQFRKIVSSAFHPFSVTMMKQAGNNRRIAHACGTCRFGEDPGQSVLNPFNRAHDISNLYITDGSFFPSSAGINPSLTIAANALRVSDNILQQQSP